MPADPTTVKRSAALFLLGGVLLNHPLIGLFNKAVLLAGMPLLYAYIFVVWLLIIVLAAAAVDRRRLGPPGPRGPA